MLGWVVHTSDSTSGLAVHYNQTLSCVISIFFFILDSVPHVLQEKYIQIYME